MASISCNSGCQSTSLALAVSLVLVLFASTAPCAQAQARPRPWSTTPETVSPLSFVNVKFVNNLAQTMNLTIGAPPSGKPQSTTLAPGAGATLAVDDQAPLQFRVKGALFIDNPRFRASAVGSLVAEVGVLSIVVVNGPCATGQAGLTLMGYADGKLVNPKGCAVRQ